jgi:hypothetical protein
MLLGFALYWDLMIAPKLSEGITDFFFFCKVRMMFDCKRKFPETVD